MGKLARTIATVAAVGLVAIQMFRPARTNPSTDPARTMAAHLAVSPTVASVMDRACRDCHSNDTTWPWYSNVAPVSWFVIDHVNSGRRHFNYSSWSGTDPDEARKKLKDICKLSRERDMPLRSYTLVHHDAELSDSDIDALCGWSQSAVAQVH